MKSKILAIFLAISLILAVPATALAGNTITITMTTGEVLGVSVSPDSWPLGTGITKNTAYHSVAPGFRATNDGNVNEDFTIAGANTTATHPWTLSGTLTNSATEYCLGWAASAQSAWPGDYAFINTGGVSLVSDVAANGGTYDFYLGLLTPLTIVGNEAHSTTVTISCAAH